MPLSYVNKRIRFPSFNSQLSHVVPNCSLQVLDKNSKWICYLLHTKVAQKVLQYLLYLCQNPQEMSAVSSVVNFECPACYCSAVERYVTSRMRRGSAKCSCMFYTKSRMDCCSPPTIQPGYCSLGFPPVWSPQIRHPCKKVCEWWRRYWRSDEVAASTKFRLVQ
jgi:hypothetical protein